MGLAISTHTYYTWPKRIAKNKRPSLFSRIVSGAEKKKFLNIFNRWRNEGREGVSRTEQNVDQEQILWNFLGQKSIEIRLEQAPFVYLFFISSFEHVKSLLIMDPNNTKNPSLKCDFLIITYK